MTTTTKEEEEEKEEGKANMAARNSSAAAESDLFHILKEGMYVEAQYPDGEMIRGRVLHKEEDAKNPQEGYITVLFVGSRLTRQRAFPRRVVNEERLVRLVDAERVKIKDSNKTLHFISSLKAINLSVVSMNKEGGHSMFRALSYQLFGTQTNWKAIRGMCVEHMINHKDYFQHFIDCEFEQYIATKKKAIRLKDFYAPGDHLDLQAISEIFDVGVRIYSDKASRPFDYISIYADPHSSFQKEHCFGCIRLFYRGDEEYDSLVEQGTSIPLKRKIGFQKAPKTLGELTEKDIKGIILQSRKKDFAINNPDLCEENTNVQVCEFTGEWVFSSETSTEKTVLAMLKQFSLPQPTVWDPSGLEVETGSTKLKLKISRSEKKSAGDSSKTLRRSFEITGIEAKAQKLVNFCEKYFEGLKLLQTRAAVLSRVI
eukprot:CAMPEP_0185258672 /NCGR_PEP_ID=MMETSP1359-20130426/7556_1 /TAXON_ID=552665 /ORGANISM="Bigelowiella longifila, Strain CCMP242" /LENGTH=427 /DNA_ID=CAMNT_0027844257 /DNA_START=54 /DNA_END=1337 /DNA_ORIENTATION=+